MSSSHKKILRRLHEIEEKCEKIEVRQEIKVENTITGQCPSNWDFPGITKRIEEMTWLLTTLSDRLRVIQKEISDIQNILYPIALGGCASQNVLQQSQPNHLKLHNGGPIQQTAGLRHKIRPLA